MPQKSTHESRCAEQEPQRTCGGKQQSDMMAPTLAHADIVERILERGGVKVMILCSCLLLKELPHRLIGIGVFLLFFMIGVDCCC